MIWFILLSVIVLWAVFGYLSCVMWRGWLYYTLYPAHPLLGTPDEQMEESGDGPYTTFIMGGPITFIALIITHIMDKERIRFKF